MEARQLTPVLGEVGADPADEEAASCCRMVAMPRSIGLIAKPEDPDDSADPTGESCNKDQAMYSSTNLELYDEKCIVFLD